MDTGFSSEQHQETAACSEYHCTTHQRDEPTVGYRLCAECGHMFISAQELVAQDYQVDAVGYDSGWTQRPPRERTPEEIHACPHCAHDF